MSDLISGVIGKGVSTKSVWTEYNKVVSKLGSEYDILRKVPRIELDKYLDKPLVDVIIKNRNQEIKVIPGYDGVYGIPILSKNQKMPELPKFGPIKNKQVGLQEFFG